MAHLRQQLTILTLLPSTSACSYDSRDMVDVEPMLPAAALEASPVEVKSKAAPAPMTTRYLVGAELHSTLFGQVHTAYDTKRGIEVIVKMSQVPLIQLDEVTSSTRSKTGAALLEDVRREARVLRLLLGDGGATGVTHVTKALTVSTPDAATPALTYAIDTKTCGISGSHAQLDAALAIGKRSIAALYDEQEDGKFHYLVGEYCGGGDLFNVLAVRSEQRVDETTGRIWFRQLCQGVLFLHAHSVTHNDLSLENACLTASHQVRLIDFGLAGQHPGQGGDIFVRMLHAHSFPPPLSPHNYMHRLMEEREESGSGVHACLFALLLFVDQACKEESACCRVNGWYANR
jgi:serine/threonine protein kinase